MLDSLRTLDYVVLLCEDLGSMRSFYVDTLGFSVHRDWDTWLELESGSVLLTLRERGRSYDGGPIGPDTAGVQLAFRVPPDEVDACHDDLRAAGVEILDAPRTQDSGHRTVFFRDPDGNVLEIYADV
jgi:glyoxylase I family protein